MNKPLCIYGLTGGPVHNGHVESYEWLLTRDYNVIVVPAIGHEFKPEALETYLERRLMCSAVFGAASKPLEEIFLNLLGTSSIKAIKTALKALGRPVMAIDLLRTVSRLQKEWTLPEGKVHFAIGPDINVEIWTGIELIRAEYGNDCFVRLPEVPGIRSTVIRANIAAKLPWEHMVPEGVAEIVKDYRMYGWAP